MINISGLSQGESTPSNSAIGRIYVLLKMTQDELADIYHGSIINPNSLYPTLEQIQNLSIITRADRQFTSYDRHIIKKVADDSIEAIERAAEALMTNAPKIMIKSMKRLLGSIINDRLDEYLPFLEKFYKKMQTLKGDEFLSNLRDSWDSSGDIEGTLGYLAPEEIARGFPGIEDMSSEERLAQIKKFVKECILLDNTLRG